MARFVTELLLRLTDAVSAPARQATQSIQGITKAIRDNNVQQLTATSRALSGRIRGLTGDLVGAGGALAAFGFALSGPIKSATAFEAKLTTIAQKANLTRQQATALGVEIVRASKATNQFATDLAEGVDVLAGAGLDPRVALRLITPIGKAATAYKVEIKDLATASFAAYSNLKVPIDQVGDALDAMAVAGKEGNFEIEDLAKYLPGLAASAAAVGQKGVPGVTDLAAALQIVRRGSSDSAEAATNLANLLQKMTAKQTVKAFEKMGVDLVGSLKRLEAEGRTPIEAIAELTNKTLGGDLSRLSYLFEDAQVQKALRPLITDMKDYVAIREKASKSKGVADKDFIERMQDAEQKMQAAKIAAQNLSRTFGEALKPAFGLVAGILGPILDRLTAFVSAHPRLVANVTLAIGALLAFKTALIAVKLANAVGKKALVDMALGFSQLGSFALNAARQVILAAVGSALNVTMFVQSLSPASITGFGRSLLSLLNPMNLVRGAMNLMRLAFLGNPIGLIAVGLGLAAVFIIRHWRGFLTFFQGVGRGIMQGLAPVMPALQPLIGWVRGLGATIAKFFGGVPGEDWSKWGVAVGNAIAWPIATLVNFIKWVGEAIAKVREFFGIRGKAPDVGTEGRKRIFGGLFGGGGKKPPPGRAIGGWGEPGHDYWVGEEGPEIVRFPRRGMVYPNGSSPPTSGGRGQAPVFSPTLNFHIAGGDPRAIADQVLARLKAEYRQFSQASFYDSDMRPA
ncbi:phage tail tape measure protein [Caulobacter sp. RL271]|uniref:Phage tail tape measure protein n=1 Tax=Caulobacter segnis TaxID=88688 RepID=A0ABY4ZZ83_9CAUL|nr:phage tail tape measure protein [Caulobacter segnis]USQ97236.1 phage tail tape measure protein [Caulobacter segnis]